MIKKKVRQTHSFTLIELLAVIIVLSIVLAIAVPGVSRIIRNSTKSAFEVDAKMVLKAINLRSLKEENFNPLIVTKENMLEQINVDPSQYSQITFNKENSVTTMILVGTGKWEGLTAYGSVDDLHVVFNEDYDETPPAIVINGNNPILVTKNSTYVDAGATATDMVDGNVPIISTIITNMKNEVVPNVDTSIYTSYNITYTAKDKNNNQSSASRLVIVKNEIPPVITILGNNPATIFANSSYSDAGATALDDVDGNITSKIVTTGSVNPSLVGTYTITYSVSDSSGNSTTATRTVNVTDNTAPSVLFGTNGNATYAKSRSTTVTLSDSESGLNTSSFKYLWTNSTTAPSEVSFTTSFTNGGTISSPVGVTGGYYLWILGKDNATNTAIVRSNVFNLDNTKPTLTLNGSSSVNVNKGSTYSDAGATASDNINGNITGSIVTTGTVNVNIVGTYTITYNVSDSSGNAATSITRTVNVKDVTAPVITISGSNPVTVIIGGTYSDAGATATDDTDGNVTSRIVTTGTVNPNALGTYIITYTVKDNANNQSVATRTVYVVDNVIPTAVFGTNGSGYVTSISTTVTVSDNVGVNASSLKYQWNTSASTPAEASFTISFTNGGTITSPAGANAPYFLWILAKDTSGNTMIARSNAFGLDGVGPTGTVTVGNISSTGYDVYVTGVSDFIGVDRIQFPTWTSYNGQDDLAANWPTNTIVKGEQVDYNAWRFRVNVSEHNNEGGSYITHVYLYDKLGNYNVVATGTTITLRTEYRYRDSYISQSCNICSNTCSRSCSVNTTSNYEYICYATTEYRYRDSYSYNSCSQCANYAPYGCSTTKTDHYGGTPPDTWYWYTSYECGCGSYDSSYGQCIEWRATGSYSDCNCTTSSGWGEWSAWSTTSATSSSTRQVETREGQICDCVEYYTCGTYDCNCTSTTNWGAWSAWNSTPVTSSSTRQVETRLVP